MEEPSRSVAILPCSCMPHGGVEDDRRTGGRLDQHLLWIRRAKIGRGPSLVLRRRRPRLPIPLVDERHVDRRPTMRTGNDARGAVIERHVVEQHHGVQYPPVIVKMFGYVGMKVLSPVALDRVPHVRSVHLDLAKEIMSGG